VSIDLREERGFTFVELLGVIILVGILAAIALPAFLNQKEGGFDAAAKSNARNLLEEVEACFTKNDDYRDCDSATELAGSGLAIGPGAGGVQVTSATNSGFRIVATSEGRSAGIHRTFEIAKPGPGPVFRTCGPARARGEGGCPASGVW
jgi:type IV pilus assembly protein PilA